MSDQINKAYSGNRSPTQPLGSFAQRIRPIYSNWETFERAEFIVTPEHYPRHSICDPGAFTTSRYDPPGDITATSLQSYPPNTLHPERSHSGLYSPDEHYGPTNASELDAWALKSYGYDVSHDGGIESAPDWSNEKQRQQVSCLKCVKVFNGRYGPRNLDRHVKTEHDHVIFPCHECPRKYRRNDALLGHERKSHPNLQRPPKIPRKRSDDSQKGSISPGIVEPIQHGSDDQISEPPMRQM